ncbi:hypothetical protein M427DRAFT_143718 [Gonapodya prolifera JEL478]|uniref:Uncharacterized protein n=1 Tax=Gonapodya prolifera (strain JEL478) TaxID=1344416 RepID=A0A139APL0_GONPJ|nr:hypothetical protein M427DRAFT_143718 [Gonapodya prolifera JEL478]|eukprot:KXS18662.1 hypothetical protein M427DRAFT_143718 [Gonapodya prolifera JEL478]
MSTQATALVSELYSAKRVHIPSQSVGQGHDGLHPNALDNSGGASEPGECTHLLGEVNVRKHAWNYFATVQTQIVQRAHLGTIATLSIETSPPRIILEFEGASYTIYVHSDNLVYKKRRKSDHDTNGELYVTTLTVPGFESTLVKWIQTYKEFARHEHLNDHKYLLSLGNDLKAALSMQAIGFTIFDSARRWAVRFLGPKLLVYFVATIIVRHSRPCVDHTLLNTQFTDSVKKQIPVMLSDATGVPVSQTPVTDVEGFYDSAEDFVII